MSHRVFDFWDKLGKNTKNTREIEGSLHPLGKNLLVPLRTRKISPPVDSSPKNVYSSPLHNNFHVITQIKASFQAAVIAAIPLLF